ncbi:fatty-acyl-CoA synthase [Methylobacterium sp. OAE515]|uniref:class I adenylate-forming enzyme family protein n=1 Tax=Methylobacterium sp. OAE515 TaxID=2817895 RepID=UPI00178A866D
MKARVSPRTEEAYARGPIEAAIDHTIGEALQNAARSWPNRVALIDGGPSDSAGQQWTFATLLEHAERTARALLARFAPGDHVAVWAANRPEWIFLEFGAALAGLTLVTINPANLDEELAFVLNNSRTKGVFVQDVFRNRNLRSAIERIRAQIPLLKHVIPLSKWSEFLSEAADNELPTVTSNNVAQIQYTSGTTGSPKGARLTHRNLVNNAHIYAGTIGANSDDTWINPMPLFHTAGCGLATLGALQTGGRLVLARIFDADLVLDLFEREHGTVMLSVPTMLGRVLDRQGEAPRDLSSWRLSTLGGAPVAPELIRRAESLGIKVAIGFGQTEASPYLTHTVPDDPHPDWSSTVGPPMAGTEIKIIRPSDGALLRIGEIGEICARGYSVMKDYFNQPDATRKAIDSEGWLHTGDLGSLDAYGYCRVQGRLKDMIIRGGENIYPREIEDVLFEHPSVADVAVIGVPDSDWGEVVVAFIRSASESKADQTALQAFCRARLAGYKVPRIWRFVDDLPLTASGKVQKFILRESYLEEGWKADEDPR